MHLYGADDVKKVLVPDEAPKMELNIIWYIIFLSILFIIYFISTLFKEKTPITHKSPTTDKPLTTDEPPTTHDPDWRVVREENIKEEVNIIKFCEYCGEKYDERGGKYCHLCGTGLEELMK